MDNNYTILLKEIIKEYKETGADLHTILSYKDSKGLPIIDILYLYQELESLINNNHICLVLDPFFDGEGNLVVGEVCDFKEMFPFFLTYDGSIIDVLNYAQLYINGYNSSYVRNKYHLLNLKGGHNYYLNKDREYIKVPHDNILSFYSYDKEKALER